MKEVREAARGRVKKIGAAPAPGEILGNSLLSIPYLADTGSDDTYLPRQYVGRSGSGDYRRLPTVEKKHAAGGYTVVCRQAVTLDLLLQTAVRQVHLSDVYCKIMEDPEEDFILGNTTLKTLGIDINDQLSHLAAGPPVVDEDPVDLGFPEVVPPSEIHTKLEEMVVAAGDNGFDKGYLNFLRETVFEYEDVFRVDLLADPPADVVPLRITLRPDAKPFRARSRRYFPAQSAFIRDHVRLLKNGIVRRNNISLWACAAVPVPKANRPNEFRLTIAYRPVNAVTIPIAIASTGSDLTSSSESVDGAYGVAGFDMPSGFSQLPLDKDSQDPMSFITDEGVWTPNRVLHGTMDSPLLFQNQMNVVFGDMLRTHLLIWIDDILLYARSPQEFITACAVFWTELVNRRSGVGVPTVALQLAMALSESVAFVNNHFHLLLLTCSSSSAQPGGCAIHSWVTPLHDKLEAVLKVVGRTKRLAAGATPRHLSKLVNSLDIANTALPVAGCVDCSDVRRIGPRLGPGRYTNSQLVDGVSVNEQHHDLLVCKSGKFDNTARRWSIIKKEAYPIIWLWAARNLTYLLVRGNGFHLYYDHKNLIYVFAPDQEVMSFVRGKLQR
ncbi:LOW QUALITY PROTEIN: hypothetical protein PHMEG_00014178 [Phytophthora megakarya]|uniref:RNA-directed DNA polymerase n=1 Tax=Phytophthora megakarya TaxID=4795 RepID=A0A225W722_9STRA|nr:LOW QUALITY PROTEIN: hypothetical protein PHMEG_00014178 [Phytophthora megakarya]